VAAAEALGLKSPHREYITASNPGGAIRCWRNTVFAIGSLVMRCENPPFEAGYGFVSPSSFANWASSILTGRSLGKVQFLKRCGTSA
jgi:hypothetical protein